MLGRGPAPVGRDVVLDGERALDGQRRRVGGLRRAGGAGRGEAEQEGGEAARPGTRPLAPVDGECHLGRTVVARAGPGQHAHASVANGGRQHSDRRARGCEALHSVKAPGARPLSPIRPEIESLELSGIGKIAAGALDDPEVIPLWFGESDIVTPAFIREAAKRALDEGKTFYNYTRGHKPLRDALKTYHRPHLRARPRPGPDQRLGLDHADGDDRRPVPGPRRATRWCWSAPTGPTSARWSRSWAAGRSRCGCTRGPAAGTLDLDAVRAAVGPRTRAVYVNSPSNPTGWVMSGDGGASAARACAASTGWG